MMADLCAFSTELSCRTDGAARIDEERAAFNPVAPYGDSKVRAEEDIAKLADGSALPILRSATAYGFSRRSCGQTLWLTI